jgi:hypothetical protein
MPLSDAQVQSPEVLIGSTIRLVATLVLGLVSCACAFFITYEVAKAGTNLMGWYVNWVIPVGPALVGLAASSGVALGARLFGVRMSGISLAATLLLLEQQASSPAATIARRLGRLASKTTRGQHSASVLWPPGGNP